MLKMLKQILQSITKPAPITPLRYAAGAIGEKVKQFASPVSAIIYARSRSKLEGRPVWFCDREKQLCYPIAWPSHKTT